MIKVTKEFQSLMNKRTDFKENAEITFANGTVLELTEKDFTVSNNTVTDSGESNGIPLGVAVCRNIQIELMNDDDRFSEYDFLGAKIRLYLTFQLSETVERIEYGTFTVFTPETYGTTVIITALDDMYKADKEYSTSLTFPSTIGAMFRDACSTIGIMQGTTTFLNDSFVVNKKPEDLTFRELFGYIAMIAGGNARIDRTGRLRIVSYDFARLEELTTVINGGIYNPWKNPASVDGGAYSPWNTGDVADGGLFTEGKDYHILGNWSNLKVDTDDVVITGIQTTYDDASNEEQTYLYGAEGYVLSIENPLIEGKEKNAVDLIGNVMVGGRFRQFSGDIVSNPTIEFMDIALLVDRKGNAYASFVTDVDFQFFGYTSIKNSAEPTLRNSATTYSEAIKTLLKAKKMVAEERTEREQAVAQLAQDLKNSSGLFMTEQKQADGSTIYYMHDKPTLSESMVVWKLTALAFGISTDGGKTYPYGFTVDGELITKLLYAEGIDADYITTGKILSKDGSCSIDLDNGVVKATGEFTTSKNIEGNYSAYAKMAGVGVGVFKYLDTETIDNATECCVLSSVAGEKSGCLVLSKNGNRDITLAAGDGRGLQIFDATNGTELVGAIYRNKKWGNGAIQLLNPGAPSGQEQFFYVGVGSDANYRMEFANWVAKQDLLYVDGQAILQNASGKKIGYFDGIHVGGSTLTNLSWKWSYELSAFVLTGTQ